MSKARPSQRSPLDDHATVKRLALEAIASEPALSTRLVFKGGSALELLFGIGMRSSIDLDFSISGDFDDAELAAIQHALLTALNRSFGRFDVMAFDLRFESRPITVSPDLAPFWGGYGIRFKLINQTLAARIGENIEVLGRNAIAVGPDQRKTFEIDISRHEWCQGSELHAIGTTAVLAYSPRMIAAEKLRAICQQMPEYRAIVRSPGGSPRARDFFDIHNLIDHFSLILTTQDFLRLVVDVFDAKRVPLDLLSQVERTREFHRPDFQSVLDTVPPSTFVLTFDEYFDSVVSLVRALQALRNE